MAWYQNRWFYIERPFPWLPIAIVLGAIASLVLLGVAAYVALAHLDCSLIDDF